MFSFIDKTEAKYKKIFFDLSIKNINNDLINLSEFKGKTVLLVNVARNVDLLNNIPIFKLFMINIKKKILLF